MSTFINTLFDFWYSKKECSTKLENEFINKIYDYAKKELREHKVEINKKIIKQVATDIMINSNCYDVILKFIEGKEIKAHKDVLQSIGYFSYIDNFIDNNNELTTYIIHYDYDEIHFIINYLYTETIDEEYLKGNCIELIILCDYLLVSYDININNEKERKGQEESSLLWSISVHFSNNYDRILLNYFSKNKNNYDNFMNVINRIWDIFNNNNCLFAKGSIRSWFENNTHLFNTKKLLKNQIFEKLFNNDEFYKAMLINNGCVDMFPQIIDSNNKDPIYHKLFSQKQIRWAIIENLVKQYPPNFDAGTLNMVPKNIFTKNCFDTLCFSDKLFLIGKYEKYDYLNKFKELKRQDITQIISLLKNKDILYDTQFIETYMNNINNKIYCNTICNINLDSQFIYIYNTYPFRFIHGNYIGRVTEIINDNPKAVGINLNSATNNIFITRGMNVLISPKCSNIYHHDQYTIKYMCYLHGNKYITIPTIVTRPSQQDITYKIILEVTKFNNFNNIKINDPIFLQTYFY